MAYREKGASLVVQMVKNLPTMQETWIQSLDGDYTWRRAQQPTPIFLPGEFHRQRGLVGYSAWGHKESDTHFFIGKSPDRKAIKVKIEICNKPHPCQHPQYLSA